MNRDFTTPSELLDAARRAHIPLVWVGAKDEFAALPVLLCNKGYIINLQSSDDGPGSHWVCVYITPSAAVYFDSFGAEVPETVLRRLRGLKVYRTNKIIQDIKKGFCGQYCLAFLEAMSAPRVPLLKRVRAFQLMWSTDATSNQRKIREWVRLRGL
jgi:hypothetical protein